MKILGRRLLNLIKQDTQHSSQTFQRDLCAFLPGALAVQSRPPSPLPRILVGIVLLMFVFLLAWAYWSEIDIMATAEGKIIPTGRTKEVHALQQSRVIAIHVTEGQRVNQGDLLLELDQSLTQADLTKTQQRIAYLDKQIIGYEYLKQEIANVSAEDSALAEAPTPAAKPVKVNIPHWALQLAASFNSQWLGLKASLANKTAEHQLTQTQIRKLETTLPLIQERANNLKALQGKKWVARTRFLEIEQQKLTAEFELKEAKDRLAIVQASIKQLQAQREQLLADTRAQYQQKYLELYQEQSSSTEEWHKAKALNGAQRLYAPVTGTVMQLSVTTLGSVVQAATPLMLIVPEDAPLEAEVLLQNKNIGFVDLNMDTTIKIHTFPFTKFGTIDGTVIQISGDAIEQEQQGLLFPVKLQLKQDSLHVGTRLVKLKPGMSLTAEMKTGKRRVIEFFLAPLLRYKDESVRER